MGCNTQILSDRRPITRPRRSRRDSGFVQSSAPPKWPHHRERIASTLWQLTPLDASPNEIPDFRTVFSILRTWDFLPTGHRAGNTITTWLVELHMANLFCFSYRIFVCVFGLLIVMLTVTGVFIWWKKRVAHSETRSRMARNRSR
ncbi:PepSY domain-containing protein [Methylosinus sp. Sm6]|uniref:PepSY domain-containing protein n=1 Tax=Methylosinus sp. Sm6 TaxID=2866948 RepID=UPI00351D0243